MDAWSLVIQQLESLITEIEAISQFRSSLDEDYVSAEPAGDRSIRTIVQEIWGADQALIQALSQENAPNKDNQDDFAGLLENLKQGRKALLVHLKLEENGERELTYGGQMQNLLDICRQIALENAKDLREIAYRIHSSQQIFSRKSEL